jgi:hypothetical protein
LPRRFVRVCELQHADRFNRLRGWRHHGVMKRSTTWAVGALALAACGDDQVGLRLQSVQTVCVAPTASVPAGAWLCGEPLSLECGGNAPPLYVRDDCGAYTLQAGSLSTTSAGTQTLQVLRPNGTVACSSDVTIRATSAPLTPRTINLWPPNHKLNTVTVEDCIGAYAACDPEATAKFVWASSDEPIDSIGDGHHAPDIVFDCDRVQVRSERQGPKDGRVYKLGVRVTDGAGVVSESSCAVVVDHDQRGVLGADSGEAYRIAFDGTLGTPVCGGPNPPPPPVVVPDAGRPQTDAGTPAIDPPVLGY